MALARATISGTLISEPEKRFTPNNIAVANFTLQVNAATSKEAPFMVRVTCWRALADTVVEQLHKGDHVVVDGRLQVNQFESASGLAKRMYEIDATNVYKGELSPLGAAFEAQSGTRSQGNQGSSYGNYQQQPVSVGVSQPASVSSGDSFPQDDVLTEDDIPF